MSGRPVYLRGDVVLVAMDFTNRSGSKVRPALVVSVEEYNGESPDVLIASITSNRNAVDHPGDLWLQNWEAANLLEAHLVDLHAVPRDMRRGRMPYHPA